MVTGLPPARGEDGMTIEGIVTTVLDRYHCPDHLRGRRQARRAGFRALTRGSGRTMSRRSAEKGGRANDQQPSAAQLIKESRAARRRAHRVEALKRWVPRAALVGGAAGVAIWSVVAGP